MKLFIDLFYTNKSYVSLKGDLTSRALNCVYNIKKLFRIESQLVELTYDNLQAFRDYLNNHSEYYHAEVFGEFTNSLRSLFLYQDASYQFYSN